MPYSQVTISNYNASPPTDDGSTAVVNRVTWAGIKTKLGDPLNTAIETLDDNVAAAFATLDAETVTAINDIIAIANSITSQTSGVMTAPSTTETFFVQTAPPAGWTKNASHNNKALRMISGTVSTGGSTAFTSVFASRTVTTSLIPPHTHSITVTDEAVDLSFSSDDSIVTGITTSTNTFTNGSAKNGFSSVSNSEDDLDGTISHSGTTGSAGSDTAMDFAVQYVDVILASKD